MSKIRMIIACCMLAVFTGCYPTGKEISEGVDSDVVTDRNNHEMLTSVPDLNTDNIIVYDSDLQEASSLKARYIVFDEGIINEIFGNGKTILEQNEFEASVDTTGIYTKFNDSSCFSIEPGRLSYYSDTNSPYLQSTYADLTTAGIIPDMLRDFYTKEKLVNFSPEKGQEKSDELIRKLKLNDVKNIGYYSVDAETVNNNKLQDKNGNDIPDWGKEQEMYTYLYAQMYNEVPLFDTYISVSVDRNMDIVKTAVDGYMTDFQETGKSKICDYNTALSKLLEYYSDIIIEEPITIRNCILTYAVTNWNTETTYVLEPVWAFTAEVTENGDSYTSTIMVNAYNGQIIII